MGGTIIEDIEHAATATHVVAGERGASIKRTAKLMIGICVTSNIVGINWLGRSGKKRAFLPCDDFLLLADANAERRYQFKMTETMKRSTNLREASSTLLNGQGVFVCKGITGKTAPPANELKLIVNAAGGTWLPYASRLKGHSSDDAIIITSDPPEKTQLSSKDVAAAIKRGVRHLTIGWLFHAVISQEVDYDWK